jgi:hypothetical protein
MGVVSNRFKFHVPHGLAREAPKEVPLLLVADGRAADGEGVRGDELAEPRERRVLRVDGAGKAEIVRGVLVADVGDGRVGERGETLERGVHLGACALGESAAAGDEERVACEDDGGGLGCGRGGRREGRRRRARVRCRVRVRGVGHVVADRVLGVAGRCETPLV